MAIKLRPNHVLWLNSNLIINLTTDYLIECLTVNCGWHNIYITIELLKPLDFKVKINKSRENSLYLCIILSIHIICIVYNIIYIIHIQFIFHITKENSGNSITIYLGYTIFKEIMKTKLYTFTLLIYIIRTTMNLF